MLPNVLMSKLKFVFVVWLFALLLSSILQPSQQTPYTVKVKFYCTKAYCKTHKCAQISSFPFIVKEISMTEEVAHRSEVTDELLDGFRKIHLEWYWTVLDAVNFEESKKYWKDLYKKHGASRTMEFSPEEYIDWGLFEFGECVSKLWLSLSGYGTSPDKDHRSFKTPRQIGHAIRQKIKFKPYIVCHLYNGHYFLLEIHVCFNDHLQQVDCFDGEENYCPETDVVHYVEK